MFEIWDTVFHWCFCSNQSSLPWKSFPRCQNTTLQVHESSWQSFHYQHIRFPVEIVSADAHQTLTLHPCRDSLSLSRGCPEPTTPRGSEPPAFWIRRVEGDGYLDEHSAPLRTGHKWLPVAVSHKFEGSLQPCQIQIFSFALLVVKWLTIFLVGNTSCHSLHSLGLFF